ncbi:MAG: hypothetical protein WDA53_08995 [Bacillota bacterium]
MKKKILLIGIIVILALGITACGLRESSGETENGDKAGTAIETEYQLTADGLIEPQYAQKIIQQTADQLIRAISEQNGEIMSQYVHPIKGVRFTPYTYVSLNKDVVFNEEEVRGFFIDQNSYFWGIYDGIGDEISLTPSQYYEEFIYSRDFKNAEQVGYNEVLSSGNTVENQFEVYENPIVVEYYFAGLAPEDGSTDWKGLRLVFEPHEKEWKLVGIIHSQWTI